MKILKFFALAIIMIVISCKDDCANDDCPVSPHTFYLKILVLDSNNRSPYMEPNKFLYKDSLEITNLTNKLAINKSFQDSSIILQGIISINSIKISYSNSISDTITIVKNTTDTECCPKFISAVSYAFSDTAFNCGDCNPVIRYIE